MFLYIGSCKGTVDCRPEKSAGPDGAPARSAWDSGDASMSGLGGAVAAVEEVVADLSMGPGRQLLQRCVLRQSLPPSEGVARVVKVFKGRAVERSATLQWLRQRLWRVHPSVFVTACALD